MAVTVAVVIENMCSSRRQKAEHVTFKTCIQTPASIALLWPKNLIKHLYAQSVQSDQHYNLTSKIRTDQTICQNRLYE
jgi:hypothetical protein